MDSAVQVSLHLFHIIPGPEQSCLMGKLHNLISVIKADKIPFSSIQRSLFSSCLLTSQPCCVLTAFLPVYKRQPMTFCFS